MEQGLHVTGQVAVRDSKFGEASAIITVGADGWKAFVASL
ncbi:DUF397 domain-containing protein [Streptomyces sp. NPDC000927]